MAGKLSDVKIRNLIKAGKPFDGISDGGGLYLCWPKGADGNPRYKTPIWKIRYKLSGKARAMNLGSFDVFPLAKARDEAGMALARAKLGFDPAGEKQERKAAALAKIEREKHAKTVEQLCHEYYKARVAEKLKHPRIVQLKIAKDIIPPIGALALEDVRPAHIDELLSTVAARAPTMANDVLRLLKNIFNYGLKRHYLATNPASAFDVDDAGGREFARKRALKLNEIAQLFSAMKTAKGFSIQHEYAIRLLLMLGVRKMELIAARWDEFDLEIAVWNLPATRTKTQAGIRIPLPVQAVELLHRLAPLSCSSQYLFPAVSPQTRMLPHIHDSTINVALTKCRAAMPGCEPFTAHDLRRSMRSQLGALRIPPHIAERCLNHTIKGVEGTYDRYEYFDERKAALQQWADVLTSLEDGGNVVPIRQKA